MTADEVDECCEHLLSLSQGSYISRITVSSDAFGSFPKFNQAGELIGYDVCKPTTLLQVLERAMFDHNNLDKVLPTMTSNPATLYQLKNKGKLAPGYDADILLLSPDPNTKRLRLYMTIAKGKVVYKR